MKDYLLRVVAKEAGVRGLAVVTTGLVNEIATQHGTQPTATAVLAEALTAGTLLGGLLKVQQRVALKLEGNGPIGKVVVEGDSYGRIRGYVGNPEVNLPLRLGAQDTAVALGSQGQLVVVRDLRLKELAESVIPLSSGVIAEELTRYLTQSEQIPSTVQLGVYVDEQGVVTHAGGVLLQALPPYDTAVVQHLTERVAELPPIADLLRSGETPETLMALILGEIKYQVLEERPLSFRCNCSWDRTWKALVSLGADEIRDLLEKEGKAEVECHFCHTEYHFDADDLQMILRELT